MATLDEEMKAAEHRMRKAFELLVKYLDRPDSEPSDMKLHRRLADDLTLANAHYVALVYKLKSEAKAM